MGMTLARPALLAVLALTGLVAACGGGGDAAQDATVAVDLKAAHSVGTSFDYSISGWSGSTTNAVSGTSVQTWGPISDITFNGTPAQVRNISTVDTVTIGGVTNVYTTTSTVWADPAAGASLASWQTRLPDGFTSYSLFTYSYPSRATAGQAGSIGTSVAYADQTLATPLGHASTSYAVAADSANSLLVTYTTQTYDPSNVLRAIHKTLRRVNTDTSARTLSTQSTYYAADGESPVASYTFTAQ